MPRAAKDLLPSAIFLRISFNAPVAQLPERDASNVGDEGESLSGSAMGMWSNPNSRGSRFRIWQPWGCKSLHAHQFHGDWLQREQQTPAT